MDHLLPLLWVKGEEPAVVLREIAEMRASGIGGFIVESRTHPDFLGPRWWELTDAVVREARTRAMEVWFFDDAHFPSGAAAGLVAGTRPDLLKTYLREDHIDAAGPRPGASFFIRPWIGPDEEFVRVVAGRRVRIDDDLDPDTLADLTPLVADGILHWDIPDGHWRVFIFARTRRGGEEGTKDYINPLLPEAVDAYISCVHERFHERYREEFGRTVAGFFTDEPRFGNAATYEAVPGRFPMVLPFAGTLLPLLSRERGEDFSRLLPCLWYESGPTGGQARYAYMNTVSRLFSENYSGRIGDWCRARGAEFIGHIVEDNGAHARLGYGPGHFFRALAGQDASGYDIVYQVWPGCVSGRLTTPFGYLDSGFFHWGLGKMASSAAHIDPRKKGRTVCEIFGAYGWQEGLKLMKWLTDHACVRGANVLVPHAFSPRFPDDDCPPHFNAPGNPQRRYFPLWAAYARRVCSLLSRGTHVAPAAVVYHAEAEWAGACEPFEGAVRELAEGLIDCDILPVDTLVSADASAGPRGVAVNGETYAAVVVPRAERWPGELVASLLAFARAGTRVFFAGGFPEGPCAPYAGFDALLGALRRHPNCATAARGELAGALRRAGCAEIAAEGAAAPAPLRHYHMRDGEQDIWFFVNESVREAVDTVLRFRSAQTPFAYDALEDAYWTIPCERRGDDALVRLALEPYESLFLVFAPDSPATRGVRRGIRPAAAVPLPGPWSVSAATAAEHPSFTPRPPLAGLGNTAALGALPRFSGTIRYETSFPLAEIPPGARIVLDLGELYETAEVFVNGAAAGVRICPPYRFDVTGLVREGENALRADVTNTLAKELGENPFDRAMPQEPSGLIGPVRLLILPPG